MFQSAGKFFVTALRRARIDQQVAAARVIEAVNDWLRQTWGQKALDYARPLYVKDQIAVIAINNAGLASELRHREAELVSYLNQRLPAVKVKAIRIEL